MLLRADSLASTHAIAAAVAGLARPGDVIVLAGDMGAGKTAFAQGFGRALGITEAITSPTFTLLHSYPCPGGRTTLHHADLYRLERTGDVDELALPELAEFNGIVLVEWGDVASAGLGDHLEIRLHPDEPDESDEPGASPGADRADVPDGSGDAERAATPDDADASPAATGADAADPDDARLIEVTASGPGWAGRWDRLADAVAAWRC